MFEDVTVVHARNIMINPGLLKQSNKFSSKPSFIHLTQFSR